MTIPLIIPPYYPPDNQEYYQDLLNQQLQTLSSQILTTQGFSLPGLTSTQVTAMTLSSAIPVLPAGMIWFNSTLKKLQFITVAANPAGPTNASIETVTST